MAIDRARLPSSARRDALVVALLVAPGLVWALLDSSVWPWDQAQYGEDTLKTLAAFREGLGEGVVSLFSLLDFKAPGLTWLGVPYAWLGGFLPRPEPALLAATLTWQAGTLVACYFSTRLVSGSRGIALAVTAFIASTPIFIAMNHQYFVEPLQTFAVALAFLLALLAPRLSSEGLFVALCGVVALAASAKTSSPLYCTLPLAIAAGVLVRRRPLTPMRLPRAARVALLAMAVGSVLAIAFWYFTHFDATLRNVQKSTFGSFAPHYGVPAGFAVKLWYWGSEFVVALLALNPLVLLAAAAGAAFGLAVGKRAELLPPGGGLIAAAAAVHLAAAFVVYSVQINDGPRFLEPWLPETAIVLAWAMSRVARLPVAAALGAGAAMQYALVYGAALGFAAPSGLYHRLLAAPERDDSAMRRLERIVARTCTGERPVQVNMVGVGYPSLSQFSANFYAAVAQHGRPLCRYTALPFAETSVDHAMRWVVQIEPTYYIAFARIPLPSRYFFLNRVSEAALAEVEGSPRWQRALVDGGVVVLRSRY